MIINVDNGGLTEEQMRMRCGKICASSIHKIMGAKGIGKGGETYLWEVISEMQTGLNKQTPTTLAMKWGNEHESIAAEHYSDLYKVGLIGGESSLGGPKNILLATPDFTTPLFGMEVKCPFNSANHSKRLVMSNSNDVKKNLTEYYWQMIAGMVVTSLPEWKFVSFDPRFKKFENKMKVIPLLSCNSEVEDDIGVMNERLDEALIFINDNLR